MCGRYASSADPDQLVEEFEVLLDATREPGRSVLRNPQDPPAGSPDHNMAPTKRAPVVLTRSPRPGGDGEAAGAGEDPVRQLRLLTWGLVPSWAKDPGTGARMANARAETVLDKPAFARAARARRCLVPASGWYEWQASPVARDAKGRPRKQPFYVTRRDGASLALAGLYEFWRDPEAAGEDPRRWLVSFTIITTAAEPGLDRIHERQPVVLEPEAWAEWLDPARTDAHAVDATLRAPAAPGRFEAWPVSTAVNRTANNGPHLLDPAPADQLDGVVDPATGEVIGG